MAIALRPKELEEASRLYPLFRNPGETKGDFLTWWAEGRRFRGRISTLLELYEKVRANSWDPSNDESLQVLNSAIVAVVEQEMGGWIRSLRRRR
jgi:hypothetical protein